MPTSLRNTDILFNDSTTQSTAARSGITTVTLTTGSPNATLTASSNQLVQIVQGSAAMSTGSITLPAMTSLPAGFGYFVFFNTTAINVALKDSGGVTREYIAPGMNIVLEIADVSTATGRWGTAYPVAVIGPDNYNVVTPVSSLKINGSWTTSQAALVKLDATNAAVVWYEVNGNTAANVYARLLTFNVSARTVTVGNTVTAISTGNANNQLIYPGTINWDTDNAGHALVTVWSASNSFGVHNFAYFGLSVSGGTLYATSATNVQQSAACGGSGTSAIYVSYLGSNSAYALSFVVGEPTNANNVYIRGCTITGTTTPTLTNSASNVTAAANVNTAYGSRTDLTTFTVGWSGSAGRAVAYTPSANTFTVTTRTNTARFDIEQGAIGAYSSFGQGGYMYSSGKSFFGANVFDVTNAGAAGVTGTLSTGFNAKPNLSTAYVTQKGSTISPVGTTSRSGSYISGTSVVAVDGITRFQCDPSTSTLNLQRSTGLIPLGAAPLFLDTSAVFYYTLSAGSTGITLYGVFADMGTPISG